jgi:hypothetical protein
VPSNPTTETVSVSRPVSGPFTGHVKNPFRHVGRQLHVDIRMPERRKDAGKRTDKPGIPPILYILYTVSIYKKGGVVGGGRVCRRVAKKAKKQNQI